MISYDEAKAAIQRIARTRDGEVMMQFLSARYYDHRIDSKEIERQVGQRDVVWMLKRLAEGNHE